MTRNAMRAVRIHSHGGPEAMVVEEVDVPAPQRGEVLIRVTAAGVNWADAARRSGEHYPFPTQFPYTVGQELVGTVEAVGPEVTAYKPGDSVFALPDGGAYAEFAIAAEHELIRVPDGLDPAEGLALAVQGLSAYGVLKDAARVQPGDVVLVQAAAGGVGLLAVQLAKLFGAGQVIASASSESKRAIALEHGADAAVDPNSGSWADDIREVARGGAVDVVLEMTGGPTFSESVALLRQFGRIVVYGNASSEPPSYDIFAAMGRNLTLRTFFLIPYLTKQGFVRDALEEMAALVAEGKLKLVIGGRYTFEQAQEMHVLLEQRATSGKLLMLPA
jgi:NADPH:quinone reductase